MSDFQVHGAFDEEDQPLDDAAFAGPNLSEEVRVGAGCRALIESEGYKLATAKMQDSIWEGFKATPLRDTEGLLYLRMLQKTLQDMHALLEDAVSTGRMSAEQLTALRESATPQAEEV